MGKIRRVARTTRRKVLLSGKTKSNYTRKKVNKMNDISLGALWIVSCVALMVIVVRWFLRAYTVDEIVSDRDRVFKDFYSLGGKKDDAR